MNIYAPRLVVLSPPPVAQVILLVHTRTDVELSMAFAFTTWVRVLEGLLAMIASASATLTMSKVGGYESLSEDPLEIVVVKSSTNVSCFCFPEW